MLRKYEYYYEVVRMKLTDENLENLLKVFTPFVLSELEEVTPFIDKTDEQRQDIMKAAIKSLEVTAILFSKMVKDDSLEALRLAQLKELIESGKVDEAAELFNKL